jgi:hypothetical protein
MRTQRLDPGGRLDSRSFGHGNPGWAVEGVAGGYDTRGMDDHFTQAGNL